MSRAAAPHASARNAHDAPWHSTACILCSLNCGVEVQADDRRMLKIRGDREHPVSRGYQCQKAARLDFYQNGANRLTEPLKRRPDGGYEAITWRQAIDEVAARLKHLRDTRGGHSLAYYGGGG
ncbi:MAG: molybdopterin-dependent oxidoreductase, partial [Acidobacteriota bacterium]